MYAMVVKNAAAEPIIVVLSIYKSPLMINII